MELDRYENVIEVIEWKKYYGYKGNLWTIIEKDSKKGIRNTIFSTLKNNIISEYKFNGVKSTLLR